MSNENNKKIDFIDDVRVLSVRYADISGSKFIENLCKNLYFENVDLSGTKITDANLSNFEIDGAQIGGAYIRNIGMPPEGHSLYDSNNIKQRPVKFENCDLNNSKITNCNLSNVEIDECNITGMKINGIYIEDLLKLYNTTKDT